MLIKSRTMKHLSVIGIIAMMMVVGCKRASDGHDHHDHDHDHDHSHEKAPPAAAAATPEQIAAYPLDACVVTNEKLDDHGKPYDIIHQGRLVRFCCKDCEEDFNKDPAKYLKIIDEAAAQKK